MKRVVPCPLGQPCPEGRLCACSIIPPKKTAPVSQGRHVRGSSAIALEDWEVYIGVKRVRSWGPEEAEFVEKLPPDEQDLVYELAVRLNIEPVETEVRRQTWRAR